jgi:hypothetical protein
VLVIHRLMHMCGHMRVRAWSGVGKEEEDGSEIRQDVCARQARECVCVCVCVCACKCVVVGEVT